jgi:5,5'-dehydrodivanillate O-demethylase
VPYGIMKRRSFTDGTMEEHPLIFPNILRQANRTQIRVPIDDTHTWVVYLHFVPSEHGVPADGEVPVDYRKPFKQPPDALHPVARFRMDEVDAQDFMAWETQGAIADRTHERLATSDRGVIMYRAMVMREIDKVRRNTDPMNVIRDPNHQIIDTKFEESVLAEKAGSVTYHLPKSA